MAERPQPAAPRPSSDPAPSGGTLALALDVWPMGSWEWEIATGRVRWSPELEAIHGLAPGTFGGRFEDFAADLHPEDRPRIEAAIERALHDGEDYHVEYRVRRPGGQIGWLETRGRVWRAPDGRPTHMAGLCLDVTTRKRAEERLLRTETLLAAIVENTTAAVFVKDLAGRYTLVNRACERLWRRPRAEIEGHTDHEVLPAASADRLRAHDLAVVRAREARQFEEEVEFPDGRHVFVTAKVPLLAADGEPYAICGVAAEITDRKRAETALVEAGRRKDQFLAMLAHELRNPLAPIQNALAILRFPEIDATRSGWALGVLERQVAHLTRVVDDLLDVARISGGRITLRHEVLDLAALVRTVVEDHRTSLEAAGLRLDTALPAEPVWVRGDATRLAQVVGNLLHNAQKFTEPDGRVTVALARGEGVDGATLRVNDDGIGMDAETLTHAFEPFGQADRSLDRARGGLGLGLALARQLIELHDGSISAASAGLAHGSTFTVTLPLAPAPPGAARPAESRGVPSQRILIVEDHADAAESLAAWLELEGHAVTVAPDARAALAAARHSPPDVVLCDVGLPGQMDGYALARAIRADPALRPIRLIALTGYGRARDRLAAIDAGFEAHVTKPADPRALRALLVRTPPRSPRD